MEGIKWNVLYLFLILVTYESQAWPGETLQPFRAAASTSDDYLNLSEQQEADVECWVEEDITGNISETYAGPRDKNYERCWIISNPENQLLHLNVTHLNFYGRSCNYVYMTITVKETGREYRYCHNNHDSRSFSVHSEVKVYFYVDRHELYENGLTNLEVLYEIDTSIGGIQGLQNVRRDAIDRLKYNSSSWTWLENVSKVVTALVLSDGATFSGRVMQEELMLKQRELRISVSLLRDSVSNEQLDMFINSLAATCHNPRNFYGRNLVKQLKNQVESSGNFTHPSAYLALCNANEPWPERATTDLTNIFDSPSKYPFLRDIQSIASMAVSCQLNRSKNFNSSDNEKLMFYHESTIEQFKKEQHDNGRFGNVHRTALITQALLARGQENKEGWEPYKAIRYLVKALNSSTVDFLTTYLTLPILNGKSLAHISSINCSAHPRTHDDLVAEIHDYLGPKIRVQYSLFIGENKDVIHTISLRVPKNFTAYNVMQLAEIKDSKYRFLFEVVNGKMDVYDISGIPNDPEDAKFWLLYLGFIEGKKTMLHLTTSPDKLILNDGDHLVMWYKTAEV